MVADFKWAFYEVSKLKLTQHEKVKAKEYYGLNVYYQWGRVYEKITLWLAVSPVHDENESVQYKYTGSWRGSVEIMAIGEGGRGVYEIIFNFRIFQPVSSLPILNVKSLMYMEWWRLVNLIMHEKIMLNSKCQVCASNFRHI